MAVLRLSFWFMPVVLLLQGLLYVSFTEASDNAFILVDKRVTITKLKDEEKLTVSISIYNAGGSTAYDVSLNDETWPSAKFDVAGNETHSWDKLEPGASVEHSLIAFPKVQGLYHADPATVTYRTSSKAKLQKALSSPVPDLDLLAVIPPEKKYEWAWNLLKKFGPVVSVMSIIGLFVAIAVTPEKPKKYSKKKTR